MLNSSYSKTKLLLTFYKKKNGKSIKISNAPTAPNLPKTLLDA